MSRQKNIFSSFSLFLVLFTLTVTLSNLFLHDKFFPYLPSDLFSLSLWGIKKGFFWQFFTQYFFLTSPFQPIEFNFFFNAFFSLFLFWKLSNLISLTRGGFHLFFFLLSVATFTSLLSLPLICLPPYFMYASINPILLALAIAVLLLIGPKSLPFISLPIQMKHLVLAILILIEFSNLSHLHFHALAIDAIGMLVGYFYALFVWNAKSYHPLLTPIEGWHERIRPKEDDSSERKTKTVPIHSGHKKTLFLDDETFLDVILCKIIDQGKHSLSWWEKLRLFLIQKKKKQKEKRRASYHKFRGD